MVPPVPPVLFFTTIYMSIFFVVSRFALHCYCFECVCVCVFCVCGFVFVFCARALSECVCYVYVFACVCVLCMCAVCVLCVSVLCVCPLAICKCVCAVYMCVNGSVFTLFFILVFTNTTTTLCGQLLHSLKIQPGACRTSKKRTAGTQEQPGTTE